MGVDAWYSNRQHTYKMHSFSAVLVVLAAFTANCKPGGYTGLGGLYKNMNQNADYMEAAKHAAKMAVNIFDDESLISVSAQRPARQSVYVPTFFTNQPQPAVAVQKVDCQYRDLPTETNLPDIAVAIIYYYLFIYSSITDYCF